MDEGTEAQMSTASDQASADPSGPDVTDGVSVTGAPEPPSWFAGKLWFWLPILPLIVADLWSKTWSFAFLRDRFETLRERQIPVSPLESTWKHSVWENGVVDFDLVAWRNTGTIWGLGKDYTSGLIVLRCFALLLLVWFASRTGRRDRLQQLVLAMILAGAIGNLYDNLFMPDRGVRDFLSFTFAVPFLEAPYVFPAFNVADSCICVGAITLAILLWRAEDPKATQAPA